MPNKTLSVRDEDLPLWERAERAAKQERTTVSALVASALAEKLGSTDTCRVKVYDYDPRKGPGTARFEAFAGRWLTDAPDPEWEPRYSEDGGPDWYTYVAETGRGRIAVYARYRFEAYDETPLFAVFDDLQAAGAALAGDRRVNHDALREASFRLGRSGKRGEEIRWRDI